MKYEKKYLLGVLSGLLLFVLPSCADTKKDVAMSTLLPHEKADKKIMLFVYHSCPYCKKVINYLKQSGNLEKVTIVDASKPDGFKELKRLGNTTQCPFLYDAEKNVKMLESSDIINYFKTRF